MDYEIGRVLEAAEKYAPDAVIIYTSDHGDMLFSHSLTGKGPAPYEENARIPLLIKGFGSRVDENPVSHINLAPAVFEMMGIDIPKAFEGKKPVSGAGRRQRACERPYFCGVWKI